MKPSTLLCMTCAGVLMAQSYTIKGPDAPKPHEANAMKELGDYLAKRIDGKLTIDGKSPVTFQVGDTSFAKAQGCLSEQLEDEQWVIKSVGDQVLLNGGGTRGALYAVYHFLEDYCDIHWWNEYEEYIPKASSLDLPALNAKGKPTFLYRDIYCYHTADKNHPNYMPFAIRNRLNRAGDRPVTADFGGSFNYGPPYHCHTFHFYVPEEKYFKEHPEYFSLIGGKRVGGKKSQLCITNPDLKQIFLDNLVKFIEKGKVEAENDNVPAPRIYDISMNDCHSWCECPNCTAEREQYGYSGYMLRFVNWMAEKAESMFPGIYISTLAYYESEPPPKGGVRARDNVVVKLCDTKTNQAASILEEDNKMFKEFVSNWRDYAKNLFIWDYAITFAKGVTGMPFASEFHYGDLFRHYHENNVTGVFWEHERLAVADFYELKFFLEAKLMEAPYQDVDALINLFMPRYYGAAAPYLLKYRRALDAKRKECKARITWFASKTAFSYVSSDMILDFQQLFDEAEGAVKGDETLTLRVRRARMGLDNMTSRRSNAVFYHGSNWKPTAKPLPTTEAAIRFFETHDKWTARFPNAADMQKVIRQQVPLKIEEQKLIPAPKELEGRNFFDCYPINFNNESPSSITVVKDADSPIGEAMRFDVAKSHYYNMPFAAGLRDVSKGTTITTKTYTKIIDGPGYHWYKIPVQTMPNDGYVFITRAWTIQVPIPCSDLWGKPFEVWISAKHVGEQFHVGQGKPEYIYIDRVVFIEPN
ncbi:MAG: DUF4838 domain-containing protein [Victivallales bacterium]|nr:DUF4838 domain-containing protein [Victivallales bacterium]